MTPNCGPQMIDELWDLLSGLLNSCGDGPMKETETWKTTFSQWKSHVRKKYRQGKMLTPVEKDILKEIGMVTVTGIPVVPELGTATETITMEIEEDDASESDAPEEIFEVLTEAVPGVVGCSYTNSTTPDKQNLHNVSTTNSASKKKKSKRQSLFDVYEGEQEVQREGLHAIAQGLNNISSSIESLCDVLKEIFQN